MPSRARDSLYTGFAQRDRIDIRIAGIPLTPRIAAGAGTAFRHWDHHARHAQLPHVSHGHYTTGPVPWVLLVAGAIVLVVMLTALASAAGVLLTISAVWIVASLIGGGSRTCMGGTRHRAQLEAARARAVNPRHQASFASPTDSLAERLSRGEITATEFRRGLVDVLKQRYVRGEISISEYEAHLDRVLKDPLV
jgi:hypothetical protein